MCFDWGDVIDMSVYGELILVKQTTVVAIKLRSLTME